MRKHLSLAVNLKLRRNRQRAEEGRGCIDHIFSLRNIFKQCTEWQRSLYLSFVDLSRVSTVRLAQPLAASGALSLCWDHQKIQLATLLLCWWWWHPIWSQAWCQAGQRFVHSAFQYCCRLDHATHHRGHTGEGQGHQTDSFLLPGRTELRTNIQIQGTTQRLNFFTKQVALDISFKKDGSFGTEQHQQSSPGWKTFNYFWTPDKSNAAPMATMFYL